MKISVVKNFQSEDGVSSKIPDTRIDVIRVSVVSR